MNTHRRTLLIFVLLLALAGFAREARAASATGITGLYYTGESSTGGTLSQGSGTLSSNSGTQDPYWAVTYATTDGGRTTDSANVGTSYVINTTSTTYSSQYPTGYWAAETGSAEWITAPGAVFTNGGGTTSPNVNAGGDGLYGYGSDSSPLAFSSTQAVLYVYTTTFTITGNAATGTAVTGLTLSLKLSADNNFDVFVNPANTATELATSTAKYVSGANAYTATSAIALTSGFVIGVNTISIEVENADAANAGNINYSGLLFYSAGFTGVVPEVGTWLPLAAAALLYALFGLGWIRSPRAGRRRVAGSAA